MDNNNKLPAVQYTVSSNKALLLLCSDNWPCQCTHKHQSVLFSPVLMIQPISKITISDTDTTCIETKKQGMKWKQCSLAHKNYSFISNRQRCKRMWLSARCITQSPPSKLKRENCFSFLGKLQLQQCNGWTEQKKLKIKSKMDVKKQRLACVYGIPP